MTDEPSGAALAFARQRAAMAVDWINGPDKAVLLVLSIMANAAGEAWPSIDTIAANASLGRRTVFDALARLETAKLIERNTIVGKGTKYRLRLDAAWDGHPAGNGTRAGAAAVDEPDPCGSRTGVGAAPVREVHSTRAGAAPKQPRTTNLSVGARGRARPPGGFDAGELVPDLPAGTEPARWFEFVEMRRAMASGPKGRPWTAGAESAALRKLGELAAEGHDASVVLERSVLNGWQGLFPPTEKEHAKRSGAARRSARDSGGVADAYLAAFDRCSAGG